MLCAKQLLRDEWLRGKCARHRLWRNFSYIWL